MKLEPAFLWFSAIAAIAILLLCAARSVGPGRRGFVLMLTGGIALLFATGILASWGFRNQPVATVWTGAALLVLSLHFRIWLENLAAWTANALGNHYRRGDWITLGELSGEIVETGLLSTTLEGPGGERITFPNSDAIRKRVLNHSRSSGKWDALVISVTHESDLAYCSTVLLETAKRVLRELPGRRSREEREPQIFILRTDSLTQVTLRLPTSFRERETRRSALITAIQQELGKPEHQGKITPGYPRVQVVLSVIQENSEEIPVMEE